MFRNSLVLFLFLVGVCNTDNFSLLSITIDYGPFGFMDEFNPGILTYIDEPLFEDLPQPTLLPLRYSKLFLNGHFVKTDTALVPAVPSFTPFS